MNEKRILIIDSDESEGEQIASYCREFNFRAAVLGRGEGILELLKTDPPNLVILNVDLIDMNGFVICKSMKVHPALKQIPVIMTSRQKADDPFKKHRKLKDAAEGYIYKPFDPDDLIEQIENLIGLPDMSGAKAPSKGEAQSGKIKEVLQKAKEQIEKKENLNAESSKLLAEKSREATILRESFENIQRKYEQSRVEISTLQQEIQKLQQVSMSFDSQHQQKALHYETQLEDMKRHYEKIIAELSKKEGEFNEKAQELKTEAQELQRRLEAAEARNNLLEQENAQRESGLKERINGLLAQMGEERQLQIDLKKEFEKLSHMHSSEINKIRDDTETLGQEKIKMEQRVIKAYKKIKMDQLRDQKLEKTLEMALALLRNPEAASKADSDENENIPL